MASTLQIDFASGADRRLALQKLQIIVDGAVAPETELRAQEVAEAAQVVFPDEVAEEQVLACFKSLVNSAGLTDSGFRPDTISLTGTVTPGSLQRTYSV